jgi:acyl-CoA thioesterase
MSSFAEATTWTADGDGAWRGEVPATWMQGRTSFGGIAAAVGLRALRSLVDEARRPRSVHVSFFGPVGSDPARVTAEVVRHGSSLTHARAELRQGGELRTQITGTFATDRESDAVVEAAPRPERPAPEEVAQMPFIDGLMPAFTRYFAFRWTDGDLPYSGSRHPQLGGWCRHETDAGPDPYVATLALIDAWPSPMVSMFRRPAPASSVSWTTMFFDVPPTIDPGGWWWFHAEPTAARAGYGGLRGSLYAPDGRLAATTEQLVALFDRPAS